MDRKPDIEVSCVEFVRDAYYKEKSMDHFCDIDWDEDKFVELLAKFSTEDSVTVPTLAKGVRAAINEYEKKFLSKSWFWYWSR